jgi:hypothetical protein
MNSNAWSRIRGAIRHRLLRSVLTYGSTLRAVLTTGGASHHGSDSIRHCFMCFARTISVDFQVGRCEPRPAPRPAEPGPSHSRGRVRFSGNFVKARMSYGWTTRARLVRRRDR